MDIERFENFSLNEKNIYKSYELTNVSTLAQIKNTGKKLYSFKDGKLVEKRFQNTRSFKRFEDETYYLLDERSAGTFNELRKNVDDIINKIDYVFKGVIQLHCEGKAEEAHQYLDILYSLITLNKEYIKEKGK